jgi:hypothetical protein
MWSCTHTHTEYFSRNFLTFMNNIEVNTFNGQQVCLTLRDPIGFGLMFFLANMDFSWQFKPLQPTLRFSMFVNILSHP